MNVDWRDGEILITRNADQFITLNEIDKQARRDSRHPFILNSIKKYKLGQDPASIRKVAKAAFNIAKFQPDPQDNQYIRTTTRLLKDRRANCVDYTMFISAFLRALKVPHIIRMASFDPNNPRAFSHIYPLTQNGLILDVVPGQDQNGLEFKKKPSERTFIFNKEVPFVSKFDKKIRS